MAIVVGLIVGLFLLLGFHLLGAGFRNPRWLFVAFCLILALYKYGENQLANDLEYLSITAGRATDCPANHIQVAVTNRRTQRITRFGFSLHGYRPNHSQHIAYQWHRSDRVIPAGQRWTSCWEVADLRDVPVSQQAVLRWEAEITSVGFAE